MRNRDVKKSRFRTAILVGSLALNLLVVGAAVGLLFSGGPRDGGGRYDLTVGPLTRAMEGPQREALRDALRNSNAFRPADRRAIRADVARLLEILQSDPFDRAAFDAVLTRQRARLQAGQDAAIAALGDIVGSMSPEEREAFAARLTDQLDRRTPRDGRREDRDGAGSGG